jgi:hypothetical protein
MKVFSGILCIVAGLSMCTIHGQGEITIFESAFHGIGIYFFARAAYCFSGIKLEFNGKSFRLAGHQDEEMAKKKWWV